MTDEVEKSFRMSRQMEVDEMGEPGMDKLEPSCDLTCGSIDQAHGIMLDKHYSKPRTLVCSRVDARYIARLVTLYPHIKRWTIDTTLPDDMWFIEDDMANRVGSEGA